MNFVVLFSTHVAFVAFYMEGQFTTNLQVLS